MTCDSVLGYGETHSAYASMIQAFAANIAVRITSSSGNSFMSFRFDFVSDSLVQRQGVPKSELVVALSWICLSFQVSFVQMEFGVPWRVFNPWPSMGYR